MRAFLSRPGDRGDKGFPVTAARKAVAEARRIVAEVEPSDYSNATAHVSVVYLARAARGEVGGFMAMAAGDWSRALVDGLQTFVDDGPGDPVCGRCGGPGPAGAAGLCRECFEHVCDDESRLVEDLAEEGQDAR